MHSPTSCYTENMKQFVINYDLNVYKCTARDFNNKVFSIGQLSPKGIFLPSPLYYKYYATPAAFENKTCLDCELLPSCKATCIQKFIEKKNSLCKKELIAESLKNRINTLITQTRHVVSINNK